ncbi:MAG: hypothetical protein ACRD4P_07025, partial [Bryobacteraceae bacterium]
FHRILGPGEHRLFVGPLRPVEIETHSIRGIVFNSFWADFLVKRRPDVVERHFTLVKTSDSQIAMIYADGNLLNVLLPAKRLLLWRGVAEIAVEVVDVIDRPEASMDKRPALQIMGHGPPAKPMVDSREVCRLC